MPRARSRPESDAYIRRVLEYVANCPGESTRHIAAALRSDSRRVSAVLTEHAQRVAHGHDGAFLWYSKGTAPTAPEQAFPPQGPSGEHATTPPVQLAPGLELKAQTVKVNGDGTLNHRYDKSHTARTGVPFDAVPDLWQAKKLTTRVDPDGRAGMQYITAVPEEIERWQLMIEAARDMCAEFRGCAGVTPAPGPRVETLGSQCMNIFALGDPHIGALADADETGVDNDLKIATRDNDMFLDHMVEIAPTASLAYFLLIGDNSHADTNDQVTPGHKHKVDVDSRAHKIFRTGVNLWCRAVQRLLRTHARVVVDIRRGNHDPITAFFMAETIRAAFALDERVEVLDNVREHNYFLWGKFLLGTTHGHRCKPEVLEHLMLADVPALCYQATAGRHWITGHVHSRNAADFRTCSWESLRTIFPGDDWAKGAAYRSIRGSVVITIHQEEGEIMRQAVGLERARRAAGLI